MRKVNPFAAAITCLLGKNFLGNFFLGEEFSLFLSSQVASGSVHMCQLLHATLSLVGTEHCLEKNLLMFQEAKTIIFYYNGPFSSFLNSIHELCGPTVFVTGTHAQRVASHPQKRTKSSLP